MKVSMLEITPEEWAEYLAEVQGNTVALLAESSSKGFFVEKGILLDFVTTFTTQVQDTEINLMNQVRKEMGWQKEFLMKDLSLFDKIPKEGEDNG